MSFAATSTSAARGGRALLLSAAALVAGLAVLFGGAGGASATSLTSADTTTTLSVSPTTATVGTSISFNAGVTASDGTTPTGSVKIIAQFTPAGSTTSSTVTIAQLTLDASGNASTSTSALAAGVYTVTASYNPQGSVAWNGSSTTATPVTLTVTNGPTTTLTLSEDAATIDANQSVTLTATLTTAPGQPAPTGQVSFTDNVSSIGQATISDGTATITKGGWAAGTYTFSASYAGDTVYASTSAVSSVTLTVNPVSVAVTTQTTITLVPATIVEGQAVTITAHVVKMGTPNPPPGGPIVTFIGAPVGAPQSQLVTLGKPGQSTLDSNGYASETVGGFSTGSYDIYAQYPGDVDDASSTGHVVLKVLPAASNASSNVASSLTYTGDTSATWKDTATLSGRLSDPSSAPVVGEQVTFAVGGDSCSGVTNSDGIASCQATIGTLPGSGTVTATFAGDGPLTGTSATHAFTVNGRPTVTTVGSTSAPAGTTATVSASLTDQETNAPVSGELVSFSVSGKACTGTTDGSGVASCTVTASTVLGGHQVTATFAADGGYLGSNGTGTLTSIQVPTTTAYTGDTQDVASTTATMSATVAPAPDGGTVTFTLGSQSCHASAAGGTASCTITLDQAPGTGYTITVSYGGDAGYGSSSTSSPFTILSPATTTKLAPVAPVLQGSSETLSATLTTALGPVSGKTLTLALGSATCTGVTNGNGVATCSVTANGPVGPTNVTASFAGDSVYKKSSDSGSTIVYAFAPGGGSFVVGDKSATGTVTFWGAQWWKVNSLSGGPAPSAFKGFALNSSSKCNVPWSTDPGNSSPPPAGPLPSYMAVIVTSASTKSGSQISGNVVGLVIVQTNAGYLGDPGHAGTGTVVATISCSS